MFFGLGVNIKFPANYRESPFTLIASGVTTLPQRLKFPFSLVRPGDPQLMGVPARLNEIVPGWNYARNAYALDRNCYKYSVRGKGLVPSAFCSLYNADTVRYCAPTWNTWNATCSTRLCSSWKTTRVLHRSRRASCAACCRAT